MNYEDWKAANNLDDGGFGTFMLVSIFGIPTIIAIVGFVFGWL